MSFATEMAAYKSSAGKEALASTAAPEPTASAASEAGPKATIGEVPSQPVPKHGDVYVEPGLNFNDGLPTGAAPIDAAAAAKAGATAPVEAPASAPSADAPVVPAKATIKIGDQEFATVEDATRYAEKLLAEKAQNDAYVEGVKDATKKPEAPPPEDPMKVLAKKFSERVFENPEEAALELINQVRAATEASIIKQYNEAAQQQHQAQTQAEAVRATRETFYKDNPDLSAPEMRDYIQETLLPHMTKKGLLKPTADLKETATAIRKQLEIMRVSTLPAKEQHSGPVTMPGASAEAASKAAPAGNEEKVDFVSQLNKLRKRKAT